MTMILLRLLLFLLPFAAYALYLAYLKHQEREHPGWKEAPWNSLVIAGLALVIVSFIAAALVGGERPGGVYVPPHTVDGKIVPGEIRRD